MNKILDFTKQIFLNKTIYRILLNWQVKDACKELSGEILDLAGGKNPCYYKYLPKDIKIIRTDYKEESNPDLIIDFNKDFPIDDESFQYIFLFNAIYIMKDRVKTLKEIKRILKKGGYFFLASPFIANEMPEPNDYCRLTYEGLECELKDAGFTDFKIIRFGDRFTSASYLLYCFWILRIIKFFVYSLCIFLDKCIPKNIKKSHPCPLGYFCIIKK